MSEGHYHLFDNGMCECGTTRAEYVAALHRQYPEWRVPW